METTTQPLDPVALPAAAHANDSNSAHRPAWHAARIILGAGLGMFLNVGPVLLFTFGLFIKPIAGETGWSTVTLAAAIGPAMLLTALLQPAIGFLLDRYGVRRCALVSFAVFGASLLALGVGPRSETGFAVFLGIATCLGAAQTPLPYSYLVSSWFDRNRGLALGVALAFSGLGVAVWPVVAGALLTAGSWRHAYAGMGVSVLVLGAVAVMLIRDPVRVEATAKTTAVEADGMTLRQALSTRAFWLLFVTFFVMSAIITGGTVHLPAMLVAQGLPLQKAASLASVVGITSIASRLMIGFALDRLPAPLVSFVVFLCPALGCMLLHAGNDTARLAAAMLGVGLGAEADVLAYIASRAFGVRHFGTIYGVLMVVFLTGVSAGPALFAYALAGHGGYPVALLAAAIGGAGAAGLMLCLGARTLAYGGRPH